MNVMTFFAHWRLKLFSISLAYLLFSSSCLAHTQVIFCDNTDDVEAQCGPEHDCVTDDRVSDEIGYCLAQIENNDQQLCLREESSKFCQVGEICKTGLFDSHIGVCMHLYGVTDSEMTQMLDEKEGCEIRGSLGLRSLHILAFIIITILFRLKKYRDKAKSI